MHLTPYLTPIVEVTKRTHVGSSPSIIVVSNLFDENAKTNTANKHETIVAEVLKII